jgi:hypothetical protein
MFGLEYLAHATGPKFFQDSVVAEDQRLGSALIDFLSLELRQMLALDELPSKFLCVFRLGLGRNKGFELAGAMTPESVSCFTNCSRAMAIVLLARNLNDLSV